MNPKEIVLNLMNRNANPMLLNLMQLAQKGENTQIEQFARNFFKEHGRDFDAEFAVFTKNFK